MRAEEYEEIIGRCEQVRFALGLNKKSFAARFGMAPQTYNNFIGAQGSKPNVPLVLGIVRTFRVRWDWLMEGVGPMFQDDAAPQAWEGDGRSFTGSETAAHNLVEQDHRLKRLESEVTELRAVLLGVYGEHWSEMLAAGLRRNGTVQPERPNCHPAVGDRKIVLWDCDEDAEALNYRSRNEAVAAHLTLEGVMRARPGDWIIRGMEGEWYPCKDSVFQAKYEPAEGDQAHGRGGAGQGGPTIEPETGDGP